MALDLRARRGSGGAFGVRNLERALAAEAVEDGKGSVPASATTQARHSMPNVGSGGDHQLDSRLIARAAFARVLGRRTGVEILRQGVGAEARVERLSSRARAINSANWRGTSKSV